MLTDDQTTHIGLVLVDLYSYILFMSSNDFAIDTC